MLKRVNSQRILQVFLRALVILCPIFTVSAFLFAVSPVAEAYSSCTLNGLSSNTALQCDNKGVYITSFSNNTLEINYIINSNVNKYTLKLQGEIKSVTTDNGIIYAISYSNDTLYLNRYIQSTDTLSTFIIENAVINSDYKFAVVDEKLYFTESDNYNTIACHSIYGEKLYSFYLSSISDYRTDNNGLLYICSQNQIYTLNTNSNNQPECKLSDIKSIRGNIFFCNDVVVDYNGNIISLKNGSIISTNITSNKLNYAMINGYYCRYSSGNIYGYTENSDTHTLFEVNAGENAQMCGFDNKLYILSDHKELFIIDENQLAFPQVNATQPTLPTTSSNLVVNYSHTANSNQNSSDSVQNQPASFSINNYYIDNNENIIWNIPNGTTLSVFKNNLIYNGYTLEFYNANGVKKTGGKIGTGFTMVVKNNSTEHSRYTTSVKGDLSGDGNVNTTDVSVLSNYLMANTQLTNEQYTASDSNGDNIINGVDVLKIARNNL